MMVYNTWYVAAWSSEVGETPLGRVFLNNTFAKRDVRQGG